VLKAPRPPEETARLAALARYEVLDTPPEPAFDDVVRLAASVCDTPIALVSLVDEARQWFKARLGLDVEETPRELAFCGHAILEDRVLVVDDAARDSRFADNPLVTREPRIRFYAGAPLETPDGYRIGTVCVIDRQARFLDDEQLASLQALARLAVDELELRWMRRQRASGSLGPVIVMCAACKRVRDENEVWHRLEAYLVEQGGIQVSHGLCDACVEPYDSL
jgi:GAF domain-containing protein